MTTSTRQMATVALDAAIREGRVEVVDWGVTVACKDLNDALLINYAYRNNHFGTEIRDLSDGTKHLTVFNEKATSMGIG